MSQDDWNQGFVVGFVAGASPKPLPRTKGFIPGVKLYFVPPPAVKIKMKPIQLQKCNFGNLDGMWYPGLLWNHNLTPGWTPASGNTIITPYKFLPVNAFPWHILTQGMTVITPMVLKPTQIY